MTNKETYTYTKPCNNCRIIADRQVPKGTPVDKAICSNCGCKLQSVIPIGPVMNPAQYRPFPNVDQYYKHPFVKYQYLYSEDDQMLHHKGMLQQTPTRRYCDD